MPAVFDPFHFLILIAGQRNLRRILRNRTTGEGTTGYALASALDLARWGRFTDAENEWIGRIDLLRKELTDSTDRVSVEDFGAGASALTANHSTGLSSTRTVRSISRRSAISRNWGILLFQIIRHLRPSVCLELGTSVGISASYVGAACALNGTGAVFTLEGAPALAELARRNHATLGLRAVSVVPGRFDETLEKTLSAIDPVDFAFIDGHHDRDATLRYFGRIKPRLSDRAIVVFDDILWSGGMRQAWRKIRTLDGPFATVDLMRMGVLLVKGKVNS
jgi:predicted O-methyltransferase YrrM